MRSIEERFWEKVVRRGDDECWDWNASKDRFGYGWLSVGQRMHHGHRISWQLHNGAIPNCLCVLHKCDNPPCTNPDHLFLGR